MHGRFGRLLGVLMLAAGLVLWSPAAARAAPAGRWWPVDGPVTRGFDPPDQVWGSGHRGIDLGGEVGSAVVAAAAGRVSWVGVIDSVPMVSVDHGGVRTTYQPVSAEVAVGQAVSGGETIGTLLGGHGDGSSLHLGLKAGDAYLDPLAWLLGGSPLPRVRLLGDQVELPTVPPAPSDLFTVAPVAGAGGRWPVAGRMTSTFGWRVNPISGARQFHSGLDLAVACGTPVVAPWGGVVRGAGSDSVRGNWVEIAHQSGSSANQGGSAPSTSNYHHLSRIGVTVGQTVTASQVVGLVGTTGSSTGCHLHFGTKVAGRLTDPATWLEADR